MFLIIVICIVSSFYLYIRWLQTYWQRKKLPVTSPEFLFGHVKTLVTKQASLGQCSLDYYRKLKKMGAKHGGIYIFLSPVYVPIEPALVKRILQTDFDSFSSHGTYHHPKDILSMNLFNLDGDNWKKLKEKLSPSFTSSKMKVMFEIVDQKTVGLVKLVKMQTSSTSINMTEILQRFTIDVIGSCALGIECNALENNNSDFRKYATKILEPNGVGLGLKFLLPWNVLGNLGFKDFGLQVSEYFTKLMTETIKCRDNQSTPRKDLLELLLMQRRQTNDSLSHNDIIAQCFIFFFAGFETSATTMSFALLELAHNEDVQSQLRNEIEEVIEENGGKFCYEAVSKMRYLDMVVKETLRKHPPVPVLPRICTKNYKVPGTDITIDQGTVLNIPILGIHSDPEFYSNPDQFDPDRFKSLSSRPEFSFIPFGEGPRMCIGRIGYRFGLLQVKMGLIALVKRFKFSPSDRTKLPVEVQGGSILLTPKGGIWIKPAEL